MENKDLISKWLNNELDARELEEFKKTSDYQAYKPIVENASKFKRPQFDEQKALQDLKARLSAPKETPVKKLNFSKYYKIAAVLVVIISSGIFFLMNRPEVITTQNSEIAVVELPDNSVVKLNADSRLKYRPSKWEKQRKLQLEGEAFFEVEKGKKFTVETDQGEVSVLGTKFNVKDRKDYFEVYCYKGAVKVNVSNREIILQKGSSVKVVAGDVLGVKAFEGNNPGWTVNESYFDAVPFIQVVTELERQFDVKIETRNVDLSQRFTGSFSHKNKEIALKAITIPLKIEYKIVSAQKVILYEE
ncbi:FecR family protein [Salinimicrobium catena]|uniref:FecR family protein n=1 Tax=Salinimicrobium catena TaxID=390640 RepID=A0A1H5JDN6_9FLAO|nr:FecR family protein [Salinimicrobium catena]SDK86807.1 FecR family protein [Salinimicrobium catena]SEE50540.1 FecR family protein [Salinimicrobium catena]